MHKRVETGLRSVRVAYLDLFFSQRHATDYIGTGRLVGFGIALILGLENGMVLGTMAKTESVLGSHRSWDGYATVDVVDGSPCTPPFLARE